MTTMGTRDTRPCRPDTRNDSHRHAMHGTVISFSVPGRARHDQRGSLEATRPNNTVPYETHDGIQP